MAISRSLRSKRRKILVAAGVATILCSTPVVLEFHYEGKGLLSSVLVGVGAVVVLMVPGVWLEWKEVKKRDAKRRELSLSERDELP